MIGAEQFESNNQQCGTGNGTLPTYVIMRNTSIAGNLAINTGGGICLEAGILDMDVSRQVEVLA